MANKRNYWEKRFNMLQEAQLNKGQSYYYELENQYKKASAAIEKEIAAWYQRFAINNEISLVEAKRLLNTKELKEFKWDVKDYIKYGEENALNQQWMKELENASARFHVSRLEALKLQIQQQIEVLYGNQLDGLDKLARNIYSEGYYHTAYEIQKGFNIGWDLQPINEQQLSAVISKPWTADGQTFKDRCWTNKQQLINSVHTELTQAIIRGDSPDNAIKTIAEQFNVSKNKAGRLIMTESAFFASQAQKDAFNALDAEKYEIVATLDSHTSEICQELDGKVFDMKDFEIGVTANPFHPWCRTTTVPYFDDEFNLGERAARGEDGKTYYVPSTMKYEDWKKTFIDKSIPKDNLKEIDNPTLKQLRESIMTKHENLLNDGHNKELEGILKDKDERFLTLYDKLSSNFVGSEYYKGSGFYSPSRRKVEMNMNAIMWENQAETGMTGAWHTKFHEEFHQLDDILSRTPLGYDSSGNGVYARVNSHFTNSHTVIGSKMKEAIESDITNVVNAAIDWANAENGTKIKHLNNLSRISSDVYKSMIRYLKTHYPTKKHTSHISMFTDAMGLATRNRLNPHGNGFWGHDASYNKDRGVDGANSETWATFGSLIATNNTEAIEAVKKLMPKTWEVYSEALEQVLDYAMNNPIEYIK